MKFPVFVVKPLEINESFTFAKLAVKRTHGHQLAYLPIVKMRGAKESFQFFGFINLTGSIVGIDSSAEKGRLDRLEQRIPVGVKARPKVNSVDFNGTKLR